MNPAADHRKTAGDSGRMAGCRKTAESMENERPADEKPAYTYMLRCKDGSFYIGWTNDLARRVKTHQAGRGGKYTRTHLPVELVYYEVLSTKQEAMSREWHLKRLTHSQKEELLENMEKNCLKIKKRMPENAE